jgi:S1-C subfamily serine protease
MKLNEFSEQIVNLVSSVKDGVVSIVTRRVGVDNFLRPMPIRGVGSGFIVDERGYIITNYHVIRNFEEVTIFLSDGRKYDGILVSKDPSHDIALLKIEEKSVIPLKMGDSDNIRVGEIVLAIGSPLGLPGPNVTIGVVSAVGRNIQGKNIILEDLIQTDAAINPGNSGGPLINTDGEVIGVTTAMIPYAQGISFAIPINTVKRFLYMVAKYGRPVHPRIGIYVSDITPQLQSFYNLPVDKGVLVVKVLEDSPAYYRGIREGDIIIEANGNTIKGSRELRRIIEDSIDTRFVRLKVIKPDGIYDIEVEIIIK